MKNLLVLVSVLCVALVSGCASESLETSISADNQAMAGYHNTQRVSEKADQLAADSANAAEAAKAAQEKAHADETAALEKLQARVCPTDQTGPVEPTTPVTN